MRGKSFSDCLNGMFSACACTLYLSPKHMSTGTLKWLLTYLKATLSLTKASHSHLYLMHQSDRPSGCNHYPMVVPFSFCVSICCSYQWLLFFNERLDFSAWYFEIQSDLKLSLHHCNWQSVSLVRPNQTSSMWLKTLSAKALLYWKNKSNYF